MSASDDYRDDGKVQLYVTPTQPDVQGWLAMPPRLVMHLASVGASLLNAVETLLPRSL